MKQVTWLHLSDLHVNKVNTGWDARRVLQTLTEDLRRMEGERGLLPDLIFFTGDLAFGHLGSGKGTSINCPRLPVQRPKPLKPRCHF